MDERARQLDALEHILIDTHAVPTRLSYEVIKSITNSFSKPLGRGGFGEVYQGTLPSGNAIAVKRLHQHSILQDLDDKQFLAEVNCLIRVQCKNIVRFLGYCADTQLEMVEVNGKRVFGDVRQRFLCFEYVPNGSLDGYLKENIHGDDWYARYEMVKGICHGLHFLHKQGIMHLDLKPDNVLLDAHMTPKITDFGLSRCFDDNKSRIIHTETIRGTWGFMPPELMKDGEMSFKTDIYCLGVIMEKLLASFNLDSVDNNKSANVDCLVMKKIIEISQRCVKTEQCDRPNMDKIINELNEIETMIQKFASTYVSRSGTGPSKYQINQPASRKLLHVHPRMLSYPSGIKGWIPYSLQLTNMTDDYLAFIFKECGRIVSSPQFHRGVIFPHSTSGVVLQLEAGEQAEPENHGKDMIVVRSKIVGEDFNRDTITVDWFEKQSCVCDVKLDIVPFRIYEQDNFQSFREGRPMPEFITQGIIKQDSFDKIISIDVHPTEPLILTGHRNHICIWMSNVSTWGDTEAFTLEKSLDYVGTFFTSRRGDSIFSLRAILKNVFTPEVSVVRFLPRKQWVLVDTMGFIHALTETLETVHSTIVNLNVTIRSLAVHPSNSYVLASADDCVIRLLDWDQGWTVIREFRGHWTPAVQVAINPFDFNNFVSVSRPFNDGPGNVETWNIESTVPHKTDLRGGFKAVDYSVITVSDRQYTFTVAEASSVQIWDTQAGKCVHTLRQFVGEEINVVLCHPTLPLIFTGTNEGTVCIWNLDTYKLEHICSYPYGGVIGFGAISNYQRLVIGLTNGVVLLGFDLQSLYRRISFTNSRR